MFTVGLHKDGTNKVPIEEQRILCVGKVLERLRYGLFGYKQETENLGMQCSGGLGLDSAISRPWKLGMGLHFKLEVMCSLLPVIKVLT